MAGVYNTFIELVIGSLTLHATEDHIMSLTHVRLTSEVAQSVVITLYDDSAFIVESEIIKGATEIEYAYGYVGGARSKTYTAQLTRVSPSFTARGVTLTLEGVPLGQKSISNPDTVAYPGMTMY